MTFGAHHRGTRQYHIRVSEELGTRVDLLVALTDSRKHGRWQRFIERLLIEAVDKGLVSFSGVHLWLRPHAHIFSLTAPGAYTLVAQGAGGERVWIIEPARGLPPMEGEERQQDGYRVDITSDEGGFDGRGVYVRGGDLLGAKPKFPDS